MKNKISNSIKGVLKEWLLTRRRQLKKIGFSDGQIEKIINKRKTGLIFYNLGEINKKEADEVYNFFMHGIEPKAKTVDKFFTETGL